MLECEYLSSELDVGPNADEAEVCEEASKCVGKAEEHGGGSWRTGHSITGLHRDSRCLLALRSRASSGWIRESASAGGSENYHHGETGAVRATKRSSESQRPEIEQSRVGAIALRTFLSH